MSEEKVICYQLELGKYLADISTQCSIRHQGASYYCKVHMQVFTVTSALFTHKICKNKYMEMEL